MTARNICENTAERFFDERHSVPSNMAQVVPLFFSEGFQSEGEDTEEPSQQTENESV